MSVTYVHDQLGTGQAEKKGKKGRFEKETKGGEFTILVAGTGSMYPWPGPGSGRSPEPDIKNLVRGLCPPHSSGALEEGGKEEQPDAFRAAGRASGQEWNAERGGENVEHGPWSSSR
jgi:hypothetical protein